MHTERKLVKMFQRLCHHLKKTVYGQIVTDTIQILFSNIMQGLNLKKPTDIVMQNEIPLED